MPQPEWRRRLPTSVTPNAAPYEIVIVQDVSALGRFRDTEIAAMKDFGSSAVGGLMTLTGSRARQPKSTT